MGFTSPDAAPTDTASIAQQAPDTGSVTTKKPDFGHNLMSYMQQRYPVMDGIANAIAAPDANAGAAPQGQMPDYSSMIAQNAQPKQSGGLSAILKLIGI